METHLYYCVPSVFRFQNGKLLFLIFTPLILLSNSSCIIYHFAAKQLIHLIWHSIPNWINPMTGYISKIWIFGWTIVLEKKSVKTVHFSWLALYDGESLTKTATYSNHCKMLCICSMERIGIFQVGTNLRIWECQHTNYI